MKRKEQKAKQVAKKDIQKALKEEGKVFIVFTTNFYFED